MTYVLSVAIVDHGSPPLTKALLDAPEQANKIIREATNKAAFVVEREAKMRAPVRTGTLRRSIHTELATETARGIEAHVGTNLRYAAFQEFGVKPFGPRRARALRFESGGKVVFAKRVRGFKGRFYFREAVELSRLKVNAFFEEAAAQIVGLLAGK